MQDSPETAWGAWVRQQPKGVLTRAMRETGLGWSTVSKAQKRLVAMETAQLLSRFTRGQVKAKDIMRRRTVSP